ncbi:SipW-dependent-type signal peptide-containing protein [Methanococcoides seepicolus]|uniref:SipW-dependent-type signal peptide-containing protein n=1 Tax=Methanococcoides seepicolus TaxID=2828780 RepID=A0A9E4ZGE6_9EURY|nr:SipW-dependent-type signal peptide-containing protein [Methanococcoides seepicolus]MCM1987121.1 SipW-dependent-type signal peptide-containing protein [Methanococcoides seepicolus]
MNPITKFIIFSILLLSLTSFGGTYSYLSDTERSMGNTITAGVWNTQVDFLEVDVSKAKLKGYGDESKLFSIVLKNTGDEKITIDMMNVGWNLFNVDMTNITSIKVTGNNEIFSGCNLSGDRLECNDFTLNKESSSKVSFHFDGKVSGPFMINFIMEDGSNKSVWFDVVK